MVLNLNYLHVYDVHELALFKSCVTCNSEGLDKMKVIVKDLKYTVNLMLKIYS